MASSGEKGKSLEAAVEAVHAVILAADSRVANADLKIERRKIIFRNEVKHEIDLWVEYTIGKGMTACFIFECKNEAKPVSKSHSAAPMRTSTWRPNAGLCATVLA